MKVVNIYYVRYYVSDGSRLSIGGVETYITNLSILCKEIGCDVRIYQYADSYFERKLDYAKVYGIKRKSKEIFRDLYNKACEHFDKNDHSINIIANDTIIPRWKVPNSIVIQHGIGFDGFEFYDKPFIFSFAFQTYKAYLRVKRMSNVEEAVCVDNNYICWYRTQTHQRKIKLIPILNFTRIGSEQVKKDDNIVKLVFARRFVKMRGTHLFAPVAKRLLISYDNIEITFAGEGPDEDYLRSLFGTSSCVFFTKYNSEESVDFHSQFNIAVVPTIYSEGTSLSLLEAMSAHCAVVCTNIGGMTNIVLDNYNGLMISPDEDELYKALSRLIEDSTLRNRLASNAYDTVCSSFSLEKWRNSWINVLENKFNAI